MLPFVIRERHDVDDAGPVRLVRKVLPDARGGGEEDYPRRCRKTGLKMASLRLSSYVSTETKDHTFAGSLLGSASFSLSLRHVWQTARITHLTSFFLEFALAFSRSSFFFFSFCFIRLSSFDVSRDLRDFSPVIRRDSFPLFFFLFSVFVSVAVNLFQFIQATLPTLRG